MFYIDDITKGSQIVKAKERLDELDEVDARRPEFNEDEELTKKVGGRFWDMERLAVRQVKEELLSLLKERGIEIDLPENIPDLIKKEVLKIIG